MFFAHARGQRTLNKCLRNKFLFRGFHGNILLLSDSTAVQNFENYWLSVSVCIDQSVIFVSVVHVAW